MRIWETRICTRSSPKKFLSKLRLSDCFSCEMLTFYVMFDWRKWFSVMRVLRTFYRAERALRCLSSRFMPSRCSRNSASKGLSTVCFTGS